MSNRSLQSQLEDFSDPRSQCFLCARNLTSLEATDEHVIPQWAQRRYDLWNQRLVLANGTDIPYRQLTVPCCGECNKYRLKPIEDSLSQTVEAGRDAVLALGPKVLFIWLGKRFYGVLYKELMLLSDRTDQNKPTIISEEFIRGYRMHRFFLQQARDLVELRNFNPGSLFVFDAQPLTQPRMEWDFTDNIETLFLGVRVGKVALLASMADGGAQQYVEDIYRDFYSLALHPIQIRELCARISYRSTLATRTPKYISIASATPQETYQMPLGGFSSKPLFEEWQQGEYAQFLSHYTGLPLEDIYKPPDTVISWLRDDDWRPRKMPFTEFPILPGGA